jgi:hypothetical protein
MRVSSAIKKAALAAVPITAISAAMMATGGPASAASYCNGWLCAQVVAVSGNYVTIRETTSNPFYGHMELQTPNHQDLNSTPDLHYAAGNFHTFYSVDGGTGTYCATEWAWTNYKYVKDGYVCFSA